MKRDLIRRDSGLLGTQQAVGIATNLSGVADHFGGSHAFRLCLPELSARVG